MFNYSSKGTSVSDNEGMPALHFHFSDPASLEIKPVTFFKPLGHCWCITGTNQQVLIVLEKKAAHIKKQ